MSGAFSTQSTGRRFRHFHSGICDALEVFCGGLTVSDFGAGIGLYADFLSGRCPAVYAYDGTPGISDITGGLVQEVNLAEPCELTITQAAYSIEVGEHIPAEYCGAFVDNLCRHFTELLVVSWAKRGQRGRGHVNCLDPNEVRELFEARGLLVSDALTAGVRSLAPDAFSSKLWVFRKVLP